LLAAEVGLDREFVQWWELLVTALGALDLRLGA
jgi:hypothetical protein